MPARGSMGQWRPQKRGTSDGRLLNKKWFIHICRDGTFTYRSAGQPVFNKRALPVYSVDTAQEAHDLQVLLCFRVPERHPDLADGSTWYKLMWVRNSQETDDGVKVFHHEHLAWVGRRMHEVWTIYINPKRHRGSEMPDGTDSGIHDVPGDP